MKSIKSVLVTIIASMTIIIFICQSVFNFTQFKSVIFKEEEEKLQLQAVKETTYLNGFLEKTGKLSETLGFTIANSNLETIGIMESTTKNIMGADSLIVGGGFWMEPYALNPQQKLFARYVQKVNSDLEFNAEYGSGTYDYLAEDWYKVALVDKNYVWTEPYLDTVTNVSMITASSAIRKNGKIIGVTTIDIGLTELKNSVQSLKVGEQGYAFVISKDGAYVSSQDESKTLDVSITDDADENMRGIAETIIQAQGTGFTIAKIDGISSYVTYSSIGETGMTLVTVLPTSEIMKPIEKHLYTSAGLFIVLTVVFLAILYWFINRQVAKPMRKLRDGISNLVKNKDLSQTIPIKQQDEIGQAADAINYFISDLYAIVQNLNTSSRQVEEFALHTSVKAIDARAAFGQVASSFQEVAVSTQHQLKSTEESARAMEEMTIGIQKIAESSSFMADSSVHMTEEALLGSKSVAKIFEQMDIVNQSVNKAAELMQSLDSRTKQISKFMNVISDIASQTNLLSLNSAIEAARAGEAGKGFSVVADEIRKLAEQSGQSAKEIVHLIAEIQQETTGAVQEMKLGVQEVHKGIAIAQDTSETFHKIMENTNRAATQIQEMSAISEQMSAASEQVTASIFQLTDIATKSASSISGVAQSAEGQLTSMNELSSSTENLSHTSTQLKQLINTFKA